MSHTPAEQRVWSEGRPVGYLRPQDRARLKMGEAATIYPVAGITGRPADATVPLYHPREVERLLFAVSPTPELLEALEPFAKFACDPPNDCHNCRAQRAIAKAKGES